MPEATHTKIVTAAMLAIGDELLSGRTKDKNIGFLADFLTLHAIDLKEVRIVADDHEAIAAALTELRNRYDLVFTSGGIGPTHDDITADAVAASFGVAIDHDPRVIKLLGDHYRELDLEFTPARKRMARIPDGSELITNPVSMAPGFKIGNVHVLAGVPSVFRAMLGELSSSLEGVTKYCPPLMNALSARARSATGLRKSRPGTPKPRSAPIRSLTASAIPPS